MLTHTHTHRNSISSDYSHQQKLLGHNSHESVIKCLHALQCASNRGVVGNARHIAQRAYIGGGDVSLTHRLEYVWASVRSSLYTRGDMRLSSALSKLQSSISLQSSPGSALPARYIISIRGTICIR